MRPIHRMLAALTVSVSVLSLASTPALAANSAIMNALAKRPELSQFKAALENTGVINELNESTTYTVFAPTNDAFAKISPEQYPCFYSSHCKDEVAQIVRNHIVRGEVPLSTSGPTRTAVFAIDNRQVVIGEPTVGHFTVDGQNVLSSRQLMRGVLHEIDGVIATPIELSAIPPLATGMPGQAVCKTYDEKIYYAFDGRPDGVSRTVVCESYTMSAR